MITERTLTKWRKEALLTKESLPNDSVYTVILNDLSERILSLTQELLDAHLIRKVSK